MRNPIARRSQQGVVLIVGLIFLMILTIIGAVSLNSTVISERLTSNFRDTSQSFQAAEGALGDGENWVQKQTTIPTAVTTCTTPPCKVWSANILGSFYTNAATWWQTNASPFSSTLGNVQAQPYYIIEQVNFVPYDLSPDSLSKGYGYYYYRVTSRGTGSTANSRTVVQSIYATQFN